jgi:hypothetical protein
LLCICRSYRGQEEEFHTTSFLSQFWEERIPSRRNEKTTNCASTVNRIMNEGVVFHEIFV